MRILTPAALQSANEQDTGEVWVKLAKLEHSSWADDPALITTDSVDVVHDGETYTSYPFDITLPDEPEQGAPVAQFVASNVDLTITRKLLAVSGYVDVSLMWVLASDLEQLVMGPFRTRLYGFSGDASTITGTLKSRFNFEQPVSYMKMTPSNEPAMY